MKCALKKIMGSRWLWLGTPGLSRGLASLHTRSATEREQAVQEKGQLQGEP